MVRRSLFCRQCNFNRWLSATNFQAGQTQAIADLMRASWKANLMLVLNRSLLNREYILMNVLKALALIVYMCGTHVMFLPKATPRYFILLTNGIFRPLNLRIRRSNSMRKVDRCSLVLIDFTIERSHLIAIEFRSRWSFLRTQPSLHSVCKER
jgi:hypothetical protein